MDCKQSIRYRSCFCRNILYRRSILFQRGIDSRQMINPVHFAAHFKNDFDHHQFPISSLISLNSLHLPSSAQLSEENIRKISQVVLEDINELT